MLVNFGESAKVSSMCLQDHEIEASDDKLRGQRDKECITIRSVMHRIKAYFAVGWYRVDFL